MKRFTSTPRLALAAVILAGGAYGCSHFSGVRAPSSYGGGRATAVPPKVMEALEEDARVNGGKVRFPPGLTPDEAAEVWHLGEGSEVYPLAWFYRMKSQFSNALGTRLYENLDSKFGVLKEPKSIADISPYPVKWIGISAAWSEEHPTRSDVRLARGENVNRAFGVKRLSDGRESIALLGVNCTFCHSSEVKLDGRTAFFEGAPNMLAIRGFFQDMFASTAKTMMTAELLEDFLRDSRVNGDPAEIAAEFSESMKRDMGLTGFKQAALGKVMNFLDSEFYAKKKATTLRQVMYEKREVLENYLIRLLKLTYSLDDVSVELRLRMRFLAASIGLDPDLPTTPEGFARTDAFGRISNLVARIKNPIPLTATASVPPMWNMQYRALFHWNGNTNSVVMRNMGQSFGLGALLTNPGATDDSKYDATTNLHNLARLESLLYKIQTPRWDDVGGTVDEDLVLAGCQTFHRTCAQCHTPEYDRVGPKHELVLHKMIPQRIVRTDETYSKLQATPVNGQPLKSALFSFTGAVRDRYYKRYDIPPALQAEWEHRELRGPELFRDTALGEEGHDGVSAYMNVPPHPTPGFPARNLAGVWATAPYLHNGSVPNLYELLKPSRSRPRIFFVGSREYDPVTLGFKSEFDSLPPIPDLEARAQALLKGKAGLISRVKGEKPVRPANIWEARQQVACQTYPERCFDARHAGNSNAGHEGPLFGTELSHRQRLEVIEFMKVLRPEPEYSRNAAPIYRWDGRSCSIVR